MLNLEVQLNFLGSMVTIFVSMAQLTVGTSSPSEDIAFLIDVSGMLFTGIDI